MRRTTNLFKNKKVEQVNYGDLDMPDLLKVLNQLKGLTGRSVLNVGGRHITMTADKLSSLIELAEDFYLEKEYVYGSDYEGDIIYDMLRDNVNVSITRPKWLGKGTNDGNFFKYYQNTEYDMTKYGIYSSRPKEYRENCLIQALICAGVSDDKLVRVRNMIVPTNPNMASFKYVPMAAMNKIAKVLGVEFLVKKIGVGKGLTKTNRKKISKGNKDMPVIELGLIEGHYFYNEQVDITQYAIENYWDICDRPNYHHIFNKDGQKKRDRQTTSFKIIECMVNNKDKFLVDIPYDDLIATNYFDPMDKIETLEYNNESVVENDYWTPPEKPKEVVIFFDFETITTDKHIPYMVCMSLDNMTFFGEDCGLKMLRYIAHELDPNQSVKLIAHNLGYDFRFIQKYMLIVSTLERGHNVMNSKCRFYKSKGVFLEILLQDSYCIIAKPLRDFARMFGLEEEKEMLPYSLYTTENCIKKRIPLSIIRPYCDNQVRQNKCGEVICEQDFEEYWQFYILKAKKWGCYWEIKGGENKIDIIKFSELYCKQDVKVLELGWTKFGEKLADLDCDLSKYCSAAQIAHDYMVNDDVFVDIFKVSATPREFIMKTMVGGRTMMCENKKDHIVGKIADFDAVSLYPSAMFRLGGYLMGRPKILITKTKQFLDSVDGYFVKIKLKQINRRFKFPLQSYITNEGVRCFTNDLPKDDYVYVGKIGLEDLIEFHKVGNDDYDIIEGYYYDEGRNDKLGSTIRSIFDKRLQAKSEGNCIQEVYKLIMNSAYGKTLLKPFGEKVVFIGENGIEKYVDKNYNSIKYYTELEASGDYHSYKVKLEEPIREHFNNCHAGCEVLEMSKRIMNEVMCLAENNNIDMYYQDTDSIHMNYDDVDKLGLLFSQKYPDRLPLIGEDMGQFHTDFSSKIITGNRYINPSNNIITQNFKDDADKKVWLKDNPTYKASPDIWSKESIFLGKKCYIDCLTGYNIKGVLVNETYMMVLKLSLI